MSHSPADTADTAAHLAAETAVDASPAAQWVGFDDLSPAAQQAIRHWTDAVSADELEHGARRFDWQEELVPTPVVIARVMAAGDHADDFAGDWDAYHAWYLAAGDVPDHGTSRWPVIETSPSGRAIGEAYLDDGWHRFHSYVRAGDTRIPVLRSRPRLVDAG